MEIEDSFFHAGDAGGHVMTDDNHHNFPENISSMFVSKTSSSLTILYLSFKFTNLLSTLTQLYVLNKVSERHSFLSGAKFAFLLFLFSSLHQWNTRIGVLACCRIGFPAKIGANLANSHEFTYRYFPKKKIEKIFR